MSTPIVDSVSAVATDWLTNSRLAYIWAGATSVFSALSVQEYVLIIGALFSAYMTYRNYRANLREKEQRRLEDEKRTRETQKQTAIISAYLNRQPDEPKERVETIQHVAQVVRKADMYTSKKDENQ